MTTSPSEEPTVLGSIQLPKEALPFLQKIFGPAAEVGELLSEKVRFFRWKSSLKVMRRAEELAKEHGLEPSEVPYKILVPLIEKASLEKEDSPLIERWARLLAESARAGSYAQAVFVDILASLSAKEVQILEEIADDKLRYFLDQRIKESQKLDNTHTSRMLVTGQVAQREAFGANMLEEIQQLEVRSDGDFSRDLRKLVYENSELKLPGLMIELISYTNDHKGDDYSAFAHSDLYGDNPVAFDVLFSKGLLSRHSTYLRTHQGSISSIIIHPTPLALSFVSACRGDDLGRQ